MKVICDNCGAMYKIPDEKLIKPVNKATCRQCSHRMLIPRPRRGADPDERTLVTAVPPTPGAAPMRAADSGPPTTPIHEPEELTAPTGGRMTDETKWVRNDMAAAISQSSGSAQVSMHAGRPSNAATERVPAHTGPATPPSAVIPQLRGQAPSSDPRAHTRDALRRAASIHDEVATQVGPDPTLTIPPRDEPAQAPPSRESSAAAAAAPAHDPRGDMGLALFGVTVALLGVIILGISSVIDASGNYGLILGASFLGMLFAVGGTVGAFLVLMTSGRGRKPAWRVASVLLAGLAALLVAGLPALARVGYDTVNGGFNAFDSGFGDMIALAGTTPGTQPTPPPALGEVPPPNDTAVAPATDPSGTATDADAGGEAADPEGTTEPDPDPIGSADPDPVDRPTTTTTRPRTQRTSTTTRSPRTQPTATTTTRVKEPELTDAEERDLPDDLMSGGTSSGTSAASSALPKSPPLKAIDLMVKSNVGVKKCFFDYQRAEGSLPKRVDVRFTIKASGNATSIGTTQGKLKGSDLESCLIRSIRSINFPPSQEGTTLTFPFVFG
ncbi:MAG: AgmX/PglI C-terminal domain-containing protein [Myxococcota bacterium]